MSFDLEWLYDIFYLEAWHLFSIVLGTSFFCYICLQARKTVLVYHYLALQGIILIWLACKVFKTLAPTPELKWIFIVAQYLAVCFVGSALLLFGYVYARGKPLSRRLCFLLNIPPTFFFVVVATNPKHHLFYSSYNFLGDTFGPLFYVYTAVTYAYLAVGIFCCAFSFRKEQGGKNIQARLLTLGIVIPLIVNALYVCGLLEPRFDLTPVSCNLSLVIFAYAIYKHRFLDIVPLGIAVAFDNLQEGVLIFGSSGQGFDNNRALARLFWLEDRGTKLRSLDEADEALAKVCGEEKVLKKLVEAIGAEGGTAQTRELVAPGEEAKALTVQVKHWQAAGKKEGYVGVVCDSSRYRELIRELEARNSQLDSLNRRLQEHAENQKHLAIVRERNRLAREIHDVLGHSLVLVLNLLESSSLLLAADRRGALQKARQALHYARSGLSELSDVLGKEDKNEDKIFEELQAELEQLADKYRLAGMKVDLAVRGLRRSLDFSLYHTVFRLCQEGLTNALRHGQAEEAGIYIRFAARETEVFILDNGRGCQVVKKGNGLSGMEERVGRLNGVLRYGSSEEGGFIVHARIPL